MRYNRWATDCSPIYVMIREKDEVTPQDLKMTADYKVGHTGLDSRLIIM